MKEQPVALSTEPVTEADRDMVAWLDRINPGQHRAHATDVRAIQREAVADYRASLAAAVRAERDALPKAVLHPGEVLHVREDTGALLTEVQRGSLRGQSAALSWVLRLIEGSTGGAYTVVETLQSPDKPPSDAHLRGRR